MLVHLEQYVLVYFYFFIFIWHFLERKMGIMSFRQLSGHVLIIDAVVTVKDTISF